MVPEQPPETMEVTTPFERGLRWQRGALAGFVAAVVMAVIIAVADLAILRDAIAGLYLQEGSLVAGVLAHVVHGTLFGVLFAVVLSDPALTQVGEQFSKTVAAGVVFALVLALVGAGVVMPMWLDTVGAATLPVPYVTGPSLVWHVVYGAVLGATFSVLDGGVPTPSG
ncbi:MAG: histidine kinase [Haloarculaceae archaeon]